MIGVLTTAPWHNSIGDIATSDVTSRHLSERGIANTPVWDNTVDVDHLVIGGGDLLFGGEQQPWKDMLSMFRPYGPHLLNAIGVDHATFEQIDWNFARDYLLCAVRDNWQAERLPSFLNNIRAVPCPATLLETMPWEYLRSLPGQQALLSLPRDEYVLVHRHPAVQPYVENIQLPMAVLDMQVWQQHPWTAGGTTLPWTHSSLVARTVVEHARVVVTSSLHLAIFALSAGKPFVVIDKGDKQSFKVRRYMERAGVAEHVMYAGSNPIEHALSIAEPIATAMVRERELAKKHLDEVATILGAAPVESKPKWVPPLAPKSVPWAEAATV